MKIRKLVSLLLCVALIMGMMAACKGKDKDTGGGGDKDVTLRWMFWDDLEATEDLMSLQYKETIEKFNDADNGYKVEVITTNLEEYDTQLNALISANNCPDVFICNPGPNMTTYVDADVTMDLTDVLKEDHKDWYDSFTTGIFDRLTYDDEIHGIPLNFASACVFYNTDIFEEAGAEVPETWTELLDVCQKIQDAGYSPLTVSASTAWCLSMVAGYLCDREGGPDNLEGVNEGTIPWTDDSFINAAYKLIDLSEYFQPTYLGDTNDQATANFYNGEAGMLIQGSWAIGQINGTVPEMEEKTGVFQFPAVEGGSDPNRWIVKTDNLLVSKDTEHLDGCIELLKAFTNEEAQKNTAEIAGKMPIIDVDVDYDKAPKELKYVQDCMETLTGTLGFYNESFPTVECGDQFDNIFVSIVMGETTPEDGMQELQKFFEDNIYD